MSMSQTKTTRAFRTISEAGEELGLQPHVLRFWESKFPEISPIKRGGGRRFYRPDDIEFIRGIKKLLHDEKHPIKDVQKLIKKKGAPRIVELGRSLEKAAREQSVAETDLLPKRIKPVEKTASSAPKPKSKPLFKRKTPSPAAQAIVASPPAPIPQPTAVAEAVVISSPPPAPVPTPRGPSGPSASDKLALEDALKVLESVKKKMSTFRNAGASN